MLDINTLKFDGHGLIPAIVQDEDSGRVLTLAYMNRESLEITLREGRTCFFSRSRQALWRKGESSGNVQRVVSVAADCDADALLVRVRPEGPACHTGARSCFYRLAHHSADEADAFTLEALYALLMERKAAPKEGSYTSYLFASGEDKILKKVGEEATEVIIAAKNDNAELRYELADLAYHLLVLMAERGLAPAQIRAELAARHVVDRKEKQERMGGNT